MRNSFKVTYEVITEESARQGDAEDRGFMLPGGWKVDADDPDTEMDLRSALALAGGPFENSGHWFSTVDPDENYLTGESTFYAIHPPDTITAASYRRLARLLRCR